jgi:hypothetical protein
MTGDKVSVLALAHAGNLGDAFLERGQWERAIAGEIGDRSSDLPFDLAV